MNKKDEVLQKCKAYFMQNRHGVAYELIELIDEALSKQEPVSFEMDELTEEWYGVLDDKTALIIYGGNRGYWSNKIYADSTPAIEQELKDKNT